MLYFLSSVDILQSDASELDLKKTAKRARRPDARALRAQCAYASALSSQVVQKSNGGSCSV